mmetsp:Transcript_103181/g.266754  ORF Transcript_103181/g.266754 Transcript_103181/m.266754 type:complete len:212 (+) Transcript_103181:59-694(+)
MFPAPPCSERSVACRPGQSKNMLSSPLRSPTCWWSAQAERPAHCCPPSHHRGGPRCLPQRPASTLRARPWTAGPLRAPASASVPRAGPPARAPVLRSSLPLPAGTRRASPRRLAPGCLRPPRLHQRPRHSGSLRFLAPALAAGPCRRWRNYRLESLAASLTQPHRRQRRCRLRQPAGRSSRQCPRHSCQPPSPRPRPRRQGPGRARPRLRP